MRLGRGDDSQKPVLLTDHASRFPGALLVIIAQKVQDPMHQKPRDFLIEAMPEGCRLPLGRCQGNHHITK